MHTRTVLKTAALIATFGLIGTAHAVPIVFDFSGGGQNAMSILVTDATTGVGMRVNARNTTDQSDAMVTWGNSGLGVRSDDEMGLQGNTGAFDSFGDNEALNFTITDLGGYSALELVAVTFVGLDIWGADTEDFGVRFDGVNPFPFATTGIGNNFTPGSNPWIVSDDLGFSDRIFYNRFRILVNGGDGVADAFRISSLTFNTVPEPHSLLLLGIGVLALGLQRRRWVVR